MRVCAVTYTHNDAELVDGLLPLLLRGPVGLERIVVVDDGSIPAYGFPENLLKGPGNVGLQLLRHERNQGPAAAKRSGLEAACASGADVILSLDADIRPHRQWLPRALPYLADPQLGLVGAEFEQGLGQDFLSGYLRELFPLERKDKAATFLGAGLWLMRAQVWRDLGGFGDFRQKSHEDLYFCRKLAASGLRLVAVNSLPVRQIRRLNRRAYARREIVYLGRAVLQTARKHSPSTALLPLEYLSGQRLEKIDRMDNEVFLYLEMFLYCSFLAWLAGAAGPGSAAAALASEKLTQYRAVLSGYPNISALLGQDLAALGFAPGLPDEAGIPGPSGLFPAPLNRIPAARLNSLLLKLEMHGVGALNQEDFKQVFSAHYLTP